MRHPRQVSIFARSRMPQSWWVVIQPVGPRPFTDPSCSTSQSLGSSGWTRFPFRDENLCLFLLYFGVSPSQRVVSVYRVRPWPPTTNPCPDSASCTNCRTATAKSCHPMKAVATTRIALSRILVAWLFVLCNAQRIVPMIFVTMLPSRCDSF